MTRVTRKTIRAYHKLFNGCIIAFSIVGVIFGFTPRLSSLYRLDGGIAHADAPNTQPNTPPDTSFGSSNGNGNGNGNGNSGYNYSVTNIGPNTIDVGTQSGGPYSTEAEALAAGIAAEQSQGYVSVS